MKKLFIIVIMITIAATSCAPQKTTPAKTDTLVVPKQHNHEKKDLGTAD